MVILAQQLNDWNRLAVGKRLAGSSLFALSLALVAHYAAELTSVLGPVLAMFHSRTGDPSHVVQALSLLGLSTVVATLVLIALCNLAELRCRTGKGGSPRRWDLAAKAVEFGAWVVLWLTAVLASLIFFGRNQTAQSFDIVRALFGATIIAGPMYLIAKYTASKGPASGEPSQIRQFWIGVSFVNAFFFYVSYSVVSMALCAGISILAVALVPIGHKVSCLRASQLDW